MGLGVKVADREVLAKRSESLPGVDDPGALFVPIESAYLCKEVHSPSPVEDLVVS